MRFDKRRKCDVYKVDWEGGTDSEAVSEDKKETRVKTDKTKISPELELNRKLVPRASDESTTSSSSASSARSSPSVGARKPKAKAKITAARSRAGAESLRLRIGVLVQKTQQLFTGSGIPHLQGSSLFAGRGKEIEEHVHG